MIILYCQRQTHLVNLRLRFLTEFCIFLLTLSRHLSFLEFLGGLPFRHLSTDKEHIMKQVYTIIIITVKRAIVYSCMATAPLIKVDFMFPLVLSDVERIHIFRMSRVYRMLLYR